ncbi:transposase [Lentibacillus cibarius]|uniref:transposase n=1 Tax=Lentibacillus cibarius TaxID=2583219 RepID=UPI001F3E2ADD|nr:transposase [Lentibacillus cibarius]
MRSGAAQSFQIDEVIHLVRKPRKKSRTGIYHIMLRGVNRQVIFEDEADKHRLLETIKRFKEKSHFKIYSYCLMDNHIHLLMKETEEPVSMIIQRISSSYVHWYNNKYDRTGHLFQERFKSECVETVSYFLTVLRYIHQNPIKAGLASNVLKSEWTSIHEYIDKPRFIDINLGLKLFSPDRAKAIQLFTLYMQESNDDKCLNDHIRLRMTDNEIRIYLAELGVPNSSLLQQMGKKERNELLVKLKALNGVSHRQLARMTGLSKSVITRAR